jgi:hypothetical protein
MKMKTLIGYWLVLQAILFFYPGFHLDSFGYENRNLTMDYREGLLTLKADQVELREILEEFKEKYGLKITGLRHRKDEVITFSTKSDDVEEVLKRFFRHLGESNYAFRYAGRRLIRVSVVPESKNRSNSSLSMASSPSVPRTPTVHSMIPEPPPLGPDKDKGKVKKYPVVRVSNILDDSQAETVGLEKGDIVVEYNGVPVKTSRELVDNVKKTSDTDTVDLMVIRDGEPVNYILRGGMIGIRIGNVMLGDEDLGSYAKEREESN